MGVISVDDIRGYRIGQECVCCDCVSNEEKADSMVAREYIITTDDVENDENLCFCDRCGRKI